MMNKKALLAIITVMALSISACGGNSSASTSSPLSISIDETPISISVSESVEPVEPEEEPEEPAPEGMYRSELTNEWISEDIKDQRPVAIMIDNESTALPHYGTSKADIVFEMMNSTLNGRITRLMCIFKDWQNIEQMGNVRSARPTNVILAPDFNAVLIHDGGPYYINDYFAQDCAKEHLSGGFARIDRGKAGFYEEYATPDSVNGEGEYAGNSYPGILQRLNKNGYSLTYNDYYKGAHLYFSNKEFSLEGESKAKKAETVELPYPHNKTKLTYNSSTGLYEYSEYGEEYTDALTGDKLTFKNVIIYSCSHYQYDDHGYMIFDAVSGLDRTFDGWYLTNGYAIPINVQKPSFEWPTVYYNAQSGEDLTLNTGKTYITICPEDSWDDVVIK